MAGLAVILLAVAAVVAGAGAGPAFGAATPAPTPTPTTTALEPRLVTAPLANGIVVPGDSLAISVALTAAASATPATSATVSIGTDPLATREQLAQWLEAPDGARTPVTVGTAELGALAAGARTSAVVRVSADDAVLTDRVPGVYPVLTTASVADATLTAASVFVVPPGDEVSVAVIVPITAPPSANGLLTRDQLTALTGEDGELSATLAGIQGTDAIIAIDPAIPAAIRVLGSSAPASAVSWLERFDALTNSRFALQFGDADPAAQAAAGVVPPLAPTSLAAYVDPAGFRAQSAPKPAPSSSTSPDADDPPTLAELLEVDADATVFWPEQLTGEVLAALSAEGVFTVADSTQIVVGADSIPARARSDASELLVTDADLSAVLSAAAAESDGIERAATLAQASALRQLAHGATTLLVALERDPDRGAVSLRAAIDAAQASVGAVPLGLDALVAAPSVDVAVTDDVLAQARVDAVGVLLNGEQSIAQFATILADPALLTGSERAEVLQLLSLEWTGQDSAWADALAAHGAQTQETLHAVGIVPPSPIQLVAADAEIPVGIRNDLPYPVTVTLHAHSDDLRLDVAASSQVSIGPQQSVRAGLPVKARVGSGTVAVELALTGPTGVRIGSPQQLEVNVRADWESIGLVVLGILAAGFLGLGVVRTVRRVRRHPNSTGTSTTGTSTGTDAEHEGDDGRGPGEESR